jgi:iron complex transport system permease protein
MTRWVLGCLGALVIAPWLGAALPDDGGFVLYQLRVPRVLLASLVGAVLGIVGAGYQAVFDNALATPSTVGTTAGAALGALTALILLPEASTVATPVVALSAFAGASVVTVGITALAASGARTEDVLLAGIALTFASSALTAGLQIQADQAATFRAMRWSLGSVKAVGYDGVALLLPFAAVTVALLLSQTRELDAMAAGHERARTQGVDVVRTRTLVLGGGALGVGAATAWCGPIAFVGLVVPHLVRRWLGASRRILLPMSALTGATYLVLADALARSLLAGRDLPVGVLTAAVGAPVLIALVVRRAR